MDQSADGHIAYSDQVVAKSSVVFPPQPLPVKEVKSDPPNVLASMILSQPSRKYFFLRPNRVRSTP